MQSIEYAVVPKNKDKERLEASLTRAERILSSARIKDDHVYLPVFQYRQVMHALDMISRASGGLS